MILIITGVNFQCFEYDIVISYSSNSSTNQSVSEANATEIYTCTASERTKLSFSFIDTIFRVTLPFIISIILDIVLIYNLTTVKRNRWLKRDESFARSVIALNFFFLITNLPYMVVGIYQNILKYNGDYTSQAYLISNLVFSISGGLASFSLAFPLVVNTIFFKAFRREFFYFFTRSKPRNGSVRPTNTIIVNRRINLNNNGGTSMIAMK